METEHPKVFISHASEDKDRFVLSFAKKLRERGIDAWVDKWEMLPGDSLIDKIFEEGVKNAQAMIVVLSGFSVQKPWVREELNAGMVKRIKGKYKVIPVIIDDCEIPEALASTLWQRIADLQSYESELERIVAAICGYTQKPPLGPLQPYTDYDKICNDLINVLMKREDLSMGDPKRRTSLLRGFSDEEQNLLERHLIDIQVDVPNIVYHVAKRLEKLDKLIGNAMRLAQNETTKRQLEAILLELES